MRSIKAILAVALCPLVMQAVTCPSGYSYYYPITVGTSSISSTLLNIPIVISTTQAKWAVSGSGGRVQNTATCCASSLTAPADLVFGSSTGSLYNWDVETYTSTSGAINVWVQVPSVTSSGATLYAFAGDSSVSTYQGNASSTYDTNYSAVYHFPNGSSLDLHDSTSNALTGAANGMVSAATGNIDGAATASNSVSGSVAANWLNVSSTFNFTAMSVEAWVKPSFAYNVNTSSFYPVIAGNLNNAGSSGWNLYYQGGPEEWTFGVGLSGGFKLETFPVTSNTGFQNTWNFIVGTLTTGDVVSLCVNGSCNSASAGSGTPTAGPNAEIFSDSAFTGDSQGWSGGIDEVKISKTNRSSDWISEEYLNQEPSSTLVSVGSESACSGSSPTQPGQVIRQ